MRGALFLSRSRLAHFFDFVQDELRPSSRVCDHRRSSSRTKSKQVCDTMSSPIFRVTMVCKIWLWIKIGIVSHCYQMAAGNKMAAENYWLRAFIHQLIVYAANEGTNIHHIYVFVMKMRSQLDRGFLPKFQKCLSLLFLIYALAGVRHCKHSWCKYQ